ncbi:radical SAM protein [Desulfatirhabdium butyrativorans]|uniref:radical SAM protein n=1 Tax=Desulfatirhabdium butyrativorans TaxID=340467 RepID=UPI0003FF04B8|nr:radical SAM protein [Desulfatirhabdium butyrativorans]
MTSSGFRYSFGPVPSRRLGKSLGINNIPAKICTYACVYCQVGQTTEMLADRRPFYPPEDIFRDVQRRLAKAREASERVDYLTVVPDGEPTLDVNLGKAIALLKTLDAPVGVITNSSLLWREDVREELGRADWVSLKIDAVQETIWRKINRPHPAIGLSQILDGIRLFAKAFTGKLVTETMLIHGLNDQDDCMKAVADFLHTLQPSRAYLSVPTRPPAVAHIRAPDAAPLSRAYQVLAASGAPVEYLIGDEGNSFACISDIGKDILSITAVHPMREEAIRMMLSRAGASWDVVERLVAQGALVKTSYDGQAFYRKNSGQCGPSPR